MLEFTKFDERSWLRWAAPSRELAKIYIMGIPFDNATSLNKGAAKGPETIRNLSVDLSDTTDDFKPIEENLLYDFGDVHPDLNWKRYFANLEAKAFELMADDKFCLFLGGDHSVTIPLHKAFFKHHESEKIGIIHFDAHYDLCPDYDGHVWSHACTEARALEGRVEGGDLTFVGVRVAEETELELIKEHPGIQTITAMNVYDRGADAVAKDIINYYKNYDVIYLTLDIDALDPAFAPGTGTPVMGGLSSCNLIKIFRAVLKNLPVKAMDLVEVAPPLDVNDITTWAALKIIHEVFTEFSE